MSAPSWPLWGGSSIDFWTDDRGWAVDRIGPHSDWCDLIACGLPSLDAAHSVARRYLAENRLRRTIEIVP